MKMKTMARIRNEATMQVTNSLASFVLTKERDILGYNFCLLQIFVVVPIFVFVPFE